VCVDSSESLKSFTCGILHIDLANVPESCCWELNSSEIRAIFGKAVHKTVIK